MNVASSKNLKDNRVFERFSARFPAKIKDARDDFGTKIQLRDASADGARLISKEHLYVHDHVTLEVKLPDGKNPMNLRGEVVWSKPNATAVWDVGIKFHNISFMHLSRLYDLVNPV